MDSPVPTLYPGPDGNITSPPRGASRGVASRPRGHGRAGRSLGPSADPPSDPEAPDPAKSPRRPERGSVSERRAAGRHEDDDSFELPRIIAIANQKGGSARPRPR